MADMRGHGVTCDERCGCPVPCPGGITCSCYTSLGTQTTSGEDTSTEHKRCTCGEHCGCNPCTCNERITASAGCKCGADCNCTSCAVNVLES